MPTRADDATWSAALAGRFRRPESIVESTRWLFVILALVSLLICVPAPLSSPHDSLVVVAFAASMALAGCLVWCYVTQRVPLAADIVCSAGIWAFALASPDPAATLGIVFGALWYLALYGSTARSLLRCCFYVAALCATLATWDLAHPDESPSVVPLLASFPIMFITVIVARQLGDGLVARERLLKRDSILAATGSQLLATKDDEAIRAIAWVAAAEICAATPELRAIRVQRLDGALTATTTLGMLTGLPDRLPETVITTHARRGEAAITETAALDAAAGASLAWVCLNLSDEEHDVWVLVGAPRSSVNEAMPAVRSLINLVQLALRNSDVHRSLTQRARADSLTGLLNRAAFTTVLADRLIDRRQSRDLHVLFVDIDDFKDVNDGLGHTAGDEVLMEVAERLRSGTRPSDACARLGGDEFAVVLGEPTPSGAAEVAQRLVQTMSEPMQLRMCTTRITVSVGIATAAAGVRLDELVHQADVAMYSAKAQGKDRARVFEPGMLRPDGQLEVTAP